MIMGQSQSTPIALSEPQSSRGGVWLSVEDEFDGLPRPTHPLPVADAGEYSDGLPRYETPTPFVNGTKSMKNKKAAPTATADIKAERRSSPVGGTVRRELKGQTMELEGGVTIGSRSGRKGRKRHSAGEEDMEPGRPSSPRHEEDRHDAGTPASTGAEPVTPQKALEEEGDVGNSEELASQQIQRESQAALASQANEANTRQLSTPNGVDATTPGSKRRRRRRKSRLSGSALAEQTSQELPSPQITAESPALEAEVPATQNEIINGDSHTLKAEASPSRKQRATTSTGEERSVSNIQKPLLSLDHRAEAAARDAKRGPPETDLDLLAGDIVLETQELPLQEPSPVMTDDDDGSDPDVAGAGEEDDFLDALQVKGEDNSGGRDSPCEARLDRRSRSRSRSLRASRRSSGAPSDSGSSHQEIQPKLEHLSESEDVGMAALGIAEREAMSFEGGSRDVVDRIVANILDSGDRHRRGSSEIIYEAPGRRKPGRTTASKPMARRQNQSGTSDGGLNIMLVVSDIQAEQAKVEPQSDEEMLDSSPSERIDDLPATNMGGQPRDLEPSVSQEMDVDADLGGSAPTEPQLHPPTTQHSDASSVLSSSSSDDEMDLDADEHSSHVSDAAGNEDLFSNASDAVDFEAENYGSDVEDGSREDQEQDDPPFTLHDSSSSASSSDGEPDPPPLPQKRMVRSILKNSSPFPKMLLNPDISPKRTVAAVVEESDFEDMTPGGGRPAHDKDDTAQEPQVDGPVLDDGDIPATLEEETPRQLSSRSTKPHHPPKSAGRQAPKSSFFAVSDSEPDNPGDAGTKPPTTTTTDTTPRPPRKASRVVAESPDNTPARNNRAAFSNLPSSQLARSTTTKRRGRPRKSLPGIDPSQPGPSQSPSAKAKPEKKLSSQLRGEKTSNELPSQPEIRTGRFTDEELRRMSNAVQQFRDDCGMSQFEVNLLIHERPREDKPLHKDLWMRVLAACPGRSRTMAINRTRRLFNNYVARSVFTPEQDEELRQMVEKHGTKWSKIGQLINRNAVDIRLRWENHLLLGDNLQKDFWTREDEARFIGIVMAALVRIQQSRGEGITHISLSAEKDLPWRDISLEMGDRAPQQCRIKWNTLRREASTFEVEGETAQLEPADGSKSSRAPGPTGSTMWRKMAVEDKHQLVRAIRETGVGLESRIPWRKLVGKKFRRRWGRPAITLAWERLKQTVPDFETKSVRRVSQYLLDQYDEHKTFQDAVEEEMNKEPGDGDDGGGDKYLTQTPRERPRVYRTPRQLYTSTPQARNIKLVLSRRSTQEDGKQSERRPGSSSVGLWQQLIDDEAEEGTSSSQEEPDGAGGDDDSSSSSEDESAEDEGEDSEQASTDDNDVGTAPPPATSRHGSIDLGMEGHPDRAQPNGEPAALASSFMPLDEPIFVKSGAIKRRATARSDASSSVNANTFRAKRKRTSWPDEPTPSRPPKRRQKAKEVIHDETDSEAEREKERQREQARLAAESDEDDDMEDIPARLPGTASKSSSNDSDSESEGGGGD